jgi:ubiquinone/menaquinone biosynthesis C-methylase UbiE
MMDAKLQRRIQRYGWDAASKVYDVAWRNNLAPAHRIMLDLAKIKQGEAVLDVACGSGFITIPAALLVGPTGRVVATDISEEMVLMVKQAATAAELENVTSARMDAEELTLPDNAFDVALCGLGLMYAPEPLNALREMHRVLVTGGRAVAAVWGERCKCGWAELFPIVDSVVQSEVCPLFFRLGTGHVLADEFRAAGFSEVEELHLSSITAFASKEEALTSLLDGGAVALAVKRFTTEVRSRVEDLLLASLADFRRSDGGYDVPIEFVIVKGGKN